MVKTLSTRSTTAATPVSSSISRTAASAGCSPGSGMPAISAHLPVSARRLSSTRPRSSNTTITTPGMNSSVSPALARMSRMNCGVAMPRAYEMPGERHICTRFPKGDIVAAQVPHKCPQRPDQRLRWPDRQRPRGERGCGGTPPLPGGVRG
ncbi:exported hypothetical protein [Actinacidiphila bryophytorum]|uniref:Uncharacterized protein n=1 Tax=Actinacidiphila bryophytorum TaxID=1436133 RepID=A0A9W4EDC0_9ACTN|nr:exported hypothetical protein [Actinacidiphila bryophytorum]